MAWLVFRSGDLHYQVDLGCVDELVAPGPMVRIPCCPGFLLGLITHDRTAIPVVDLSQVSGATGRSIAEPTSILVFRGGQGMWGLPVDRGGLHVVHEEPQDNPQACGASENKPALLDPTAVWEQVRHDVETWFQALATTDEGRGGNSTPNQSLRLIAEGGPWASDARSSGGESRPSA